MTTAPYVRRLATDEELRDDLSDLIRSANNLMSHIRSDRKLRRDVDNIISSMQSGAEHLRSDVSSSHPVRNFLIGAALMVMGAAAAIAFGWPRARHEVTRVAGQTATRANATVHDIRGRFGGQSAERAA